MVTETTDDPDVLWMVGWCLAYLAGETIAGTSLVERALALNPNCAQAWLARAVVNCFACHNDAAIEALQHVMRLSPLDPLGHLVKFAFALAHLQSARYEQAIEWADQALMQRPGFTNAMLVRAAACGHLDRREEAFAWVGKIREVAPQLTVSGINSFLSGFFVPKALAYQVDGLIKAGLAR
jgi:tetratricopeptide (TPR) repeat protein